MHERLLQVLACPKCGGELSCSVSRRGAGGEIEAGALGCAACGREYPVEDGVPRFVPRENYAASFGYQWNLFREEQIDSVNRTKISADRLWSETGWTPESLRGQWVLDAGCGAGRFLDVASQSEGEIVGMDISSAIDAAKQTLAGRPNVHFVQASIYEPPFRAGAFDALYCIGVIQHTPDPAAALRTLPRFVRPGGPVAVTIYERRPWTPLYGKYLIRPLTKRLSDRTLLGVIRATMPVLFPVTEVAFRLPVLKRVFQFAIPVANYVDERQLPWRERYRWAVLDTFDMLSPEYDQPQTQGEVESALASAGVVELRRLPNPGVNVVGRRAE
jgi:uncharacterized protein YbaR (Trm112 family)